MGKMAESFNTTVPALEDELTQLILDDQIQARIDSHNKVILAKVIAILTVLQMVFKCVSFLDPVRS